MLLLPSMPVFTNKPLGRLSSNSSNKPHLPRHPHRLHRLLNHTINKRLDHQLPPRAHISKASSHMVDSIKDSNGQRLVPNSSLHNLASRQRHRLSRHITPGGMSVVWRLEVQLDMVASRTAELTLYRVHPRTILRE